MARIKKQSDHKLAALVLPDNADLQIGHGPARIKPTTPTQASEATAEQLIAEHNKLDEWLKAEIKRFSEFLAPYKARLEEINNQLLALSNLQKWDSIRTDAGTAYRSTLLNASVSPEGLPYAPEIEGVKKEPVFGREALLDFALDNWDDIGNDLLLISAQKDAVKRWMEAHDGQPPPGIKTGFFTRINIRKS